MNHRADVAAQDTVAELNARGANISSDPTFLDDDRAQHLFDVLLAATAFA